MDVYSIKQHIISNPHCINQILEESGYHKIREMRDGEIRCAYDMDTNSTSIKINKDTLSSVDFGRGVSGDIITLVEDKVGLGFRDSLKFICNVIGLDAKSIESRKIVLPFGGFFKNIGKNYTSDKSLEIIDESVLQEFSLMPSKMFFDDGIGVQFQSKYNVGFDVLTQRVIIPHYNTVGELVGIVGRVNSKIVEEDVPKYFPIISFPKSQVLYGFDKNYTNILNKKTIILAEGEKSVMKLDSMGLGVGLAVGGSFISDIQAKNIQSSTPKSVIIGFDEGLDEEHLRIQANKLKMQNPFVQIQVGYIWDENSEILKKGSKSAPMDKTKKEFEYLVRNCVKWI